MCHLEYEDLNPLFTLNSLFLFNKISNLFCSQLARMYWNYPNKPDMAPH